MNATLTRRAVLKLLGGLSALSIVPAGLSACTGGGSGSQGQGGGSRKIGVLQLTEHPALDASNKGFVDALDEAGITYNIDQQNAQNDQSACQTIAHKLVNDGNDLILAIATPAAQAVAGATDEIPIVGTAITDFASAGLVQSNDKPGKNVTGSSDLTPVADQFDLLVKLLPQAKLADQAAANHGLKLVRYSVSSSNEIQQVVESMVGKVDVVYTPTDNTIAAGMTTVTMITNDNKLPTICGEEGMVDNGGLATYGINYEELGKLAGQMAVKILKGESKPADMAIEHLDASKCTLKTNEETAKKLGIDLSVLNS